MHNDQSLFFLEILSAIKQAAYTAHDSLDHISADNLTLSDFQYYKATHLGIFQVNRLCSSAEYLFANDNSNITYSSYNIEQLLEQISSEFSSTISEYFPVSVKHYTRLSRAFAVYTDERKLELAILQLFYCSLKNSSFESFDPIKITFYATETNNHIVFHIRDNAKTLSNSVVSSLNSPVNSILFKGDELNFNAVMAQSVAVANKAISELSGKLEYTPLKSGNRFDIYLPKHPVSAQIQMASPNTYIPDLSLYSAIFAEFKLAHTLNKMQKPADRTEDL